jgi:carboxypeptidase C (cathepsin A)
MSEHPNDRSRPLAFGAGDGKAGGKNAEAKEPKDEKPVAPPRRFVTSHEGSFNGKKVAYAATAGEIHLKDGAGKPRCSIFSTSYVKSGKGDPARRPVTFLFNGGPGSASLWLHLGAFGPKRLPVPSDGRSAGAPPFLLVHNPLCPLDATDLVFVDPVGTGYSHALGEAKAEEFWGLDVDAANIAEFLKQWLTDNRRWASPIYLAGESYGTTRAVAVAGKLHGMLSNVALNGLALISVIIDFHTARFDKGNPLADACFLPTYAATALHHDAIRPAPKNPAGFLDQARRFAIEEYVPALMKGNRLDKTTRGRVLRELARLTGLSESWLDRTNLRIEPTRFRKELLRDKGVSVGRLDSRYLGEDYDDAGEVPDADPSAYAIAAAYTAAMNDYLTRTLKVEMDRPYVAFNEEALKNWDWYGTKDKNKPPRWPGYVNVAPELGRVQRENPALKVLMANGLYDLATPFFAVENSVAGNGIDPKRIEMAYYESGHMMYVHEPSLKRLMADFRRLVGS